jgi:beta-1,4-mannosyl-glycoprotein beta-1,4-N-acetylglucosaminyltransferase
MRLYDTFPFDGELDLLEHRLIETYDLIDKFVIVEAEETYSGLPKKLTFAENQSRFEWAAPKIRHIQLDSLGRSRRSARERAAIQRNAIRLALHDAQPDDAILLFDVDEIASRVLLERLRADGIDQPRRVLMSRHYVHPASLAPCSPCCLPTDLPFATATPYLHPGEWSTLSSAWYSASAVVAPFRALQSAMPFDLRFGEIDAAPLADGGRHFSSVDPSTHLERKLQRVFHTEWAGTRETSTPHLARCRANGVHHRGWWYAERPYGPLPEDVARLMRRIGDGGAYPPLWRRRLLRAWAGLRLQRWLPAGLVAFVDRHYDPLLPLTALPLLLVDLGRQCASMVMNPRPDISLTNVSTSRSHVERSIS